MHRRSILFGALLAAGLGLTFGPALAQDQFITVASTTSTENSGLFDDLLPMFQEKTGIEVRVVAVGTGQAIELARERRCRRAVRAPQAVRGEVRRRRLRGRAARGHVQRLRDRRARRPIRPASRASKDVVDALGKIAAAEAPFASRGDDSGTHKAELALWQEAGVDVAGASGTWYRETGSGMGPTLNTAAGMDAYALTDRGTWLSFENRAEPGDPGRGRSASVQPVRHHPGQSGEASARQGRRSARSSSTGCSRTQGQEAIGAFKINGQQAFFPNAKAGSS